MTACTVPARSPDRTAFRMAYVPASSYDVQVFDSQHCRVLSGISFPTRRKGAVGVVHQLYHPATAGRLANRLGRMQANQRTINGPRRFVARCPQKFPRTSMVSRTVRYSFSKARSHGPCDPKGGLPRAPTGTKTPTSTRITSGCAEIGQIPHFQRNERGKRFTRCHHRMTPFLGRPISDQDDNPPCLGRDWRHNQRASSAPMPCRFPRLVTCYAQFRRHGRLTRLIPYFQGSHLPGA